MKRIFALIVTFALLLMLPCGCAEPQEPLIPRQSITLTIAQTLPGCAAFEYRGKMQNCFYAYDTEGTLYRVIWDDLTGLREKAAVTVEYRGDARKPEYSEPPGGWSPRYEITADDVQQWHYPGEKTVSHIWIQSGSDTIRPAGCMTWSCIENEDGTCTESAVDKYDVVDFVNGKTPFSPDNIPQLTLRGSVACTVQMNGSVENVYLLSQSGDGYIKSGTKVEDLSTLSPGRYYVVLEVLLGGNCDPETPQKSCRYEDVFCLIVDEQTDIVPYDAMSQPEPADGKLFFQ